MATVAPVVGSVPSKPSSFHAVNATSLMAFPGSVPAKSSAASPTSSPLPRSMGAELGAAVATVEVGFGVAVGLAAVGFVEFGVPAAVVPGAVVAEPVVAGAFGAVVVVDAGSEVLDAADPPPATPPAATPPSATLPSLGAVASGHTAQAVMPAPAIARAATATTSLGRFELRFPWR